MSMRARLEALSAKLSRKHEGGEVERSGEMWRAGGPPARKKKKVVDGGGDPSARYLKDPLSAPIVGRWRSDFASHGS